MNTSRIGSVNDILDRIIVLENTKEDTSAIFDTLSATLFKTSTKATQVLQSLKNNKPISEISKKFHISEIDINTIVNNISNILSKKEAVMPLDALNNSKLGTLRLIISSDCNLRCKYCYAHGGSYNQYRHLMDAKNVYSILTKVYSEYESVDEISFFGGEPLLNIDVIKKVCSFLEEKVRSGKISKMPLLALITNMTLISDEFIDLVNKYNILVIASIDGPLEINDKLRVFSSGKGSFETISKNILRLKKATGQPMAIEITYTMEHFNSNYTYSHLMRYFKNLFDIEFFIINPVIIPKYMSKEAGFLALNNEAMDHLQNTVFDELMDIFIEEGLIEETILSFIARIGGSSKFYLNNFCSAGLNQIAITNKGDMYPCQMFVDLGKENNTFYMGNVLEDKLLKSQKFLYVQEKLNQNKKDTDKECLQCYAKEVCKSCLGIDYKDSGSIIPKNINYCRDRENVQKSLINNLMKIYVDSDRWNKFIYRAHEKKEMLIQRGLNI